MIYAKDRITELAERNSVVSVCPLPVAFMANHLARHKEYYLQCKLRLQKMVILEKYI